MNTEFKKQNSIIVRYIFQGSELIKKLNMKQTSFNYFKRKMIQLLNLEKNKYYELYYTQNEKKINIQYQEDFEQYQRSCNNNKEIIIMETYYQKLDFNISPYDWIQQIRNQQRQRYNSHLQEEMNKLIKMLKREKKQFEQKITKLFQTKLTQILNQKCRQTYINQTINQQQLSSIKKIQKNIESQQTTFDQNQYIEKQLEQIKKLSQFLQLNKFQCQKLKKKYPQSTTQQLIQRYYEELS